MSPENGRVREIDISGVDDEGKHYYWTGFDKTIETGGKFWGVPIEAGADGNRDCRPAQLTEGRQVGTIRDRER